MCSLMQKLIPSRRRNLDYGQTVTITVLVTLTLSRKPDNRGTCFMRAGLVR